MFADLIVAISLVLGLAAPAPAVSPAAGWGTEAPNTAAVGWGTEKPAVSH